MACIFILEYGYCIEDKKMKKENIISFIRVLKMKKEDKIKITVLYVSYK